MQIAPQRPQRFPARWLLRAASLAAVMLLAACGFALRGVTPLPFDTLYVGIADNTRFGADVRRALRAASPNTRLVDQPDQAQAILQQVHSRRTLREVSLNAQGRVEEYELGIDFTFRLITNKGVAILPDTTLRRPGRAGQAGPDRKPLSVDAAIAGQPPAAPAHRGRRAHRRPSRRARRKRSGRARLRS
jgi:hypothetical protein